jgi:hypothetical protein
MRNHDYLPGKDKDLEEWVINFLTNLLNSLGRFGFPYATYENLQVLRNTFSAKLAAADNPMTRTPGVIRAKNAARKSLTQALRQAVQQWLAHNPAVTDEDRDNLGLPVYKSGRTPSPVETHYPDFDVDSSVIRCLVVFFYKQGGKRAGAKPAGQSGAEIRWAILDKPPVSVEDMIHSSFDTHSPFTLSFDENQRGKTVYFCLRWENTRGEKGPWSEIVSAIIP